MGTAKETTKALSSVGVLDDPELPERIRAADSDALRAVVRAYLGQILRAARSAGLAPELAEEVAQKTFTTFIEKAEKFVGANKQGYAPGAVYAASKAATRSLARSLSAALLPRRIRVNAISPGLIDTPLTAEVMSERFREAVVKAIPMGRSGRPEEIAKAALFLASDDSSYVVGVELDVDGGIIQL